VPREQPADGGRPTPPDVGAQLRERRLALDVSVRELARRLSLSPSLISQIERGKATPSVGTLYAMTTELGLSMDALFSAGNGEDAEVAAAATGAVPGNGRTAAEVQRGGPGALPGADLLNPVVRPDERKRIQLAAGVRWERLTRSPDPYVDFLHVVYEPGAESCGPEALMRHGGREYGHVLSGTLSVTVGFDTHVLGPGDSISFDSTQPHRLATVGEEPVYAIWFVVGRLGDPRTS
jgi:mannose-6-phosphate isomerase-like protein (cupin superfamily)/DNA-binding XRE family transcriptional regulator